MEMYCFVLILLFYNRQSRKTFATNHIYNCPFLQNLFERQFSFVQFATFLQFAVDIALLMVYNIFTLHKGNSTMKQSTFATFDGKSIALYVWDDVASPKGVVKICHGMAEHAKRYDEFAQHLNKHGYVVVATDNRGHGLSAKQNSLGFEDGEMFANDAHDQIDICAQLKAQHNLPVFLFGHSYGSFVTQSVVCQPNNLDGFVLCGSNYMKGISFKLCHAIAKWMCKHKGGNHPAQLIANLSFGMYEKKFPGKNAWLNRDADQVALYNNDELCGFVCSANFYRCFMKGVSDLYGKKSASGVDKRKPILLVAGSDDPVGNYGKGVQKLCKFYAKTVGVQKVATTLYPGARHEILNEPLCKADVFQQVCNYLDGCLSKTSR